MTRHATYVGASDMMHRQAGPEAAWVRQREHPRVAVPRHVPVFARLRAPGMAFGVCRGVVLDLSLGGMAVELIEGHRFGGLPEGEQVALHLELDGAGVDLHGTVVASHARVARLRFRSAANGDLNGELLAVMAQIASARLTRVEHARYRSALAVNLGHLRISGPGLLDLRVQAQALAGMAPWWQIVFLDHVVAWGDGGLASGSVTPLRAGTAAASETGLSWHARPAPELVSLAAQLAARCKVAFPDLTADLDLILATARPHGE